MGKLSQLRLPTEDIAIPGTDDVVTVRGLGFTDIDTCYASFKDVVEQLVDRFGGRPEPPPMREIAEAALSEAPDLAALIIASANDQPDQMEVARRLPAVTQLAALLSIIRLTVDSAETLKKILAMLSDGLPRAMSLLSNATEQIDGASGSLTASASGSSTSGSR